MQMIKIIKAVLPKFNRQTIIEIQKSLGRKVNLATCIHINQGNCTFIRNE